MVILWVNKGATNEYLTRYPYTTCEKTRQAYEYILRGLAGKGNTTDYNCGYGLGWVEYFDC